jgi:hypothetical protein
MGLTFLGSARWPITGLLLVLAIILGSAAMTLLPLRMRPPHFETPGQLATFAAQQGLYIHSGWGDGRTFGCNGYVSDHPLDIKEIAGLRPYQCGLPPVWRGIVFIDYLDRHAEFPSGLTSPGVEGEYRIWGPLIIMGDPDLLDRLEELCRRP